MCVCGGGGGGEEFETRMTASVLKQDPNTYNIQKNAIYEDKTQNENFRVNPFYQAKKKKKKKLEISGLALHLIFHSLMVVQVSFCSLVKGTTPDFRTLCFVLLNSILWNRLLDFTAKGTQSVGNIERTHSANSA